MFGSNNETVTTTFVAKDQMTPAVRGIRNTMDQFKRDAKTGFGLAAGFSVFNTAKAVIGDVTGFLMDAAEAAMEDEKSVTQLHATMRANVPGWERYAAAIDDAAEKGLALAFSDDEVRGSLNRLIPYTKDVTEAIRLNALAMDIARAKNMSLEDAAALVGKAYAGQVTALRRAGIAIGNAKTSTEALGRAQESVAGQAEAYASTTEGSYKTLQLTIDELTETLGYELLPYMKKFVDYLRTDVIPNIDEWSDSLRELIRLAELATALVPKFGSNLSEVGARFREANRPFNILTDTWVGSMRRVGVASEDAGVSIETGFGGAVRRTIRDMTQTMDEAKAPWQAAWKELAAWAKDPFRPDKFENWLETRVQAALNKARRAEQRHMPGVAQRWRRIAKLMQDPVFAALIKIGVGVDQALADIASVRLAGQQLNQFGRGLFNVFGNDGDGGGSATPAGDNLQRQNRRNRNRNGRGDRGQGDRIVVNVDGKKLFEIMDGRQGRAIAMGG